MTHIDANELVLYGDNTQDVYNIKVGIWRRLNALNDPTMGGVNLLRHNFSGLAWAALDGYRSEINRQAHVSDYEKMKAQEQWAEEYIAEHECNGAEV